MVGSMMSFRRQWMFGGLVAAAVATVTGTGGAAKPASPPSILVITVDALRADRLGCYGYQGPTSPAIDRLVAAGVRFERAWTPEPLTAPAMCSMVTGLEPHHHGASRNGLRMQPGLASLPMRLSDAGWRTSAIVGSWTLKHNLTLLGDHFDHYGERLQSRRWFGLVNRESDAHDVTDDAVEWLEGFREAERQAPFFLWTHYIEPHAPYKFQKKWAGRLGIGDRSPRRADRYDTEIAAVDEEIGRLLGAVRAIEQGREPIIVFLADHGESLGEHHYWGHGRYLYEPSLRIPMAVTWRGHIRPGTVSSQASLLDLAPTLLELVGVEPPPSLPGRSWAEAALGGPEGPEFRRCFQAHKGAVKGDHDSDRARSKGLLWVGTIEGQSKELFHIGRQVLQVFDLGNDPAELDSLVLPGATPSPELLACLTAVTEALGSLDRLTTQQLDEETVERLRALGYLD